MKKIEIKNRFGKTLGFIIEEKPGYYKGTDYFFKILGYYDESKNMTYDYFGKPLTSGNILSSLIMEEAYNKKRV